MVKNSIFFKGCFASQKAKKMVFSTKVAFLFQTPRYDILLDYALDRKQGFLDHKNVILTWSKNLYFS